MHIGPSETITQNPTEDPTENPGTPAEASTKQHMTRGIIAMKQRNFSGKALLLFTASAWTRSARIRSLQVSSSPGEPQTRLLHAQFARGVQLTLGHSWLEFPWCIWILTHKNTATFCSPKEQGRQTSESHQAKPQGGMTSSALHPSTLNPPPQKKKKNSCTTPSSYP